MSRLELSFQQAWGKEPRGGWPDPIRVPRPFDVDGLPARERTRRRSIALDSDEGKAALASIGFPITYTAPDGSKAALDANRRRPKMRDRSRPDGPYRPSVDGDPGVTPDTTTTDDVDADGGE